MSRQQKNDESLQDTEEIKGKFKRGTIREEDLRRTTQLIYHFHEGEEFHTLCKPRDLFQQRQWYKDRSNLPLWPFEVLCLPSNYKFIYTPPTEQEPFYNSDEHVVTPKIRSPDGLGNTVYSNMPGPQAYFTQARSGASHGLKPQAIRDPDDITLLFESRFESGNLAKAIQVGRWDYELLLRPDLYTCKHTQWYFFCVSNMRAGQVYRFTIINFYKSSSLYGQTLQPLCYSMRDAEQNNKGWRRYGYSIKYFKTNVKRKGTKDYYYALTWSCDFPYSNDTCYFAHCYPFTYSDMLDHLSQISADPVRSQCFKCRTLCHTIAGNPVPLVTITSSSASLEESKLKRAVVVTARVHPGETNSSWMMKGLIDYLTGNSADAKLLRDMFVFKIVPMLNPDGVVIGNYRCSLAGRDLNRNYKNTLKDAYPTVWHCKDMVKKLVAEREVVVFCDLHGHSRKLNVFIYGCENNNIPTLRLRERIFPVILAKNAPTKFCYKSSRFKVQKSKEGTGRIVMWTSMGIMNSYTMEATFCGSSLGKQSGIHFTTADLEAMGYHFCDTLLDYCDPDQTKVIGILRQLEDERRELIRSRMIALGREIPKGIDLLDIPLDSELESDLESSDGGSDSSVSDGPPVHMIGNKSNKRKAKRKLLSRKERSRDQRYQLHMTHKPVKPSIATVGMVTHNLEAGIQSHAEEAATVCAVERSCSEVGITPVPSVTFKNRNGGIPIFTQERIEERHRKKNGSSSSIALETSLQQLVHMETVTQDYIANGIPHASVHDLHKELHKASHSNHETPYGRHEVAVMNSDVMTVLPDHVSRSRPHMLLETEQQGRGSFTSQYVANHLQDLIASPSGTQLLLSSAAAAATAATATAADTNKLVSLSHLFRQQHLAPHRPTFHRHKETRYHDKPDVAKMKLVNHHSNTGPLLPPVNPNPDDHHGNPEHTCSSTDSELLPDEKQLTDDDRQFMSEIRRAPWQPQTLALTEHPVNGSNNRTESVLYEYHLSQPTKVSVDSTTLPTVHRTTTTRKKAINTRMTVQQQYKFPYTATTTPTLYDHNRDILTTKQLLNKMSTEIPPPPATATSSIAHHKDRIAQAVELAATNSGRTTSSDDAANSKVAEIRLVFDNSPPPTQQQQLPSQQVTAIPAIGTYKGDQWSRPVFAAAATGNRPHTTDCGITGRSLLVRKPATRAGGMRPIPENASKCVYVCVCVSVE